MDSSAASSKKKSSASSSSRKHPRGGRAMKPMHEQRFSNYVVFGYPVTVCLGIFILFYALVLVTLWPLLMANLPQEDSSLSPNLTSSNNGSKNNSNNNHHLSSYVPPSLKEAHVPGQEKLTAVAGALKKKLQQFRQGRGVTDEALLDQAKQEFEVKRKQKAQERKQMNLRKVANNLVGDTDISGARAIVGGGGGGGLDTERQGFIVLGMHRSGTSMLSGLLHTSCGYTVGGPLIGSSFDNEKGFFERIDIVLQNDEFMRAQDVMWAANVVHYDWNQALQDKQEKEHDNKADFFKNGKPGLAFLNNPKNSPWMQKDPRMCITLKTWLKLMNNEPAVVFTYRHPLEVAMSLKKREQKFSLERGLRLWIVYNMRAVQNSKGLCIVKSSNDAILASPVKEVQRISDELTSKCKLPEPPSRLTQEDVDKFIDPSLQHNKKQREEQQGEKEVIQEYNDGKCIVYSYESEQAVGTIQREREGKLYGFAMKIYCDFQSGAAYEDDYKWPEL